MPDPDADHIRCLTDGICLSARISGAGWKIARGSQPESFFPRLEFFDWEYKKWQVVWDGNQFQLYHINAATPDHSSTNMQYLGCEADAHHHSKKWQVTYDKATNKFSHTQG
jgi:hypothetical protein